MGLIGLRIEPIHCTSRPPPILREVFDPESLDRPVREVFCILPPAPISSGTRQDPYLQLNWDNLLKKHHYD